MRIRVLRFLRRLGARITGVVFFDTYVPCRRTGAGSGAWKHISLSKQRFAPVWSIITRLSVPEATAKAMRAGVGLDQARDDIHRGRWVAR